MVWSMIGATGPWKNQSSTLSSPRSLTTAIAVPEADGPFLRGQRRTWFEAQPFDEGTVYFVPDLEVWAAGYWFGSGG